MGASARPRLILLTVAALWLAAPRPAAAQLGSLLSPGPLTKAHADLEGVTQCTQCHERGRRVSAERCLSCHKPVAQRIAQKVGIHRNVTDDCVSCHVEHHGVNGELRPFDEAKFNHATDTRFPLDGKHAPLASKCESCHKTRSFLEVTSTCVSCHDDVHKSELGTNCQQCHSTAVEFSAAARAFDHRKTDFPLTGAHASAACASCHKTNRYTGVQFASCANCHETPHPKSMTGACDSCHTTATWTTRKFNHGSTDFPLAGKHADVACASCHRGPPLTSKTSFETCATCHRDPHQGEFTEDCEACHTEKGFTNATFDHAVRTAFPLTEGHLNVACASCHKGIVLGRVVAKTTADFRGASADCASCHTDPHQADLGNACATCHSTTTFALTTYAHTRSVDFVKGRHATVACEGCHKPAALVTSRTRIAIAGGHLSATPTACSACHDDAHRGEVGTDCAACHSINAEGFAADRFSHDRSSFKLTGAHAKVACDQCHGPAPGSNNTGLHLKGIGTTCRSCHEDVHLGQVGQTCASCHDTNTFDVSKYVHKKNDSKFFVGPHLAADCTECHKQVTGTFPDGTGTAVQFKMTTDCVSCHADVHRGSMGTDCRPCHQVTGRLGGPRKARP